MAQALPLTKLAGLLVKTLAKPLSKRIKHDFSRFTVTKNMLIGLGQTSHTITSRFTILSAGYKVRSITPLEPEKALKYGAELLGETFIFTVSGGIAVWEYNRSQASNKRKEAEKFENQKAENAALQAKLNALDLRLKAVENVVKQNAQSILNLSGGGKYVEPPSDALVPIDDKESENQREVMETEQSQEAATSVTATKSWWKVW